MTNALSRICRLSLLMIVMVGFTSALVGCETWKGLGKDVEDVGDSMQGDDSGKDDTGESDSNEG